MRVEASADAMEPIQTLYEREPAPAEALSAPLRAIYGGGLEFPQARAGRPYVIANFVSTLDGVISYDLPGQRGGGPVSGENEADHALMGLLRACSDVVIFGAKSLSEDSGHVRTPAFIYPPLADAWAELRANHGQPTLPLNVVVSGSGAVDLNEPNFHHPDLRVLIATTNAGGERLAQQELPVGVTALVVEGSANGGVAPGPLLATLRRDYGVRLALHEGGPSLFTSFLRADCLDELFLTLAPQFAGRTDDSQRAALIQGYAFTPASAPWGDLLSVKRSGAHLFLRYELQASAAAISQGSGSSRG
jgi:riboflavin biosynthesis pyrimidine reductase